ncbi:CAP domain-containing protein [Glacieibacterium sp.]|uniref:CAP domain-containing protein n=1 Tax=Glacieibacterium sp. TaxID=2860237 RepID=UPI003AFFC8C3
MLIGAVIATILSCAGDQCPVVPPFTPVPGSFEARVLSAHNREREALCEPLLAWDTVAAADAAAWAKHLTKVGTLVHQSDDGTPGPDQGENLFSGTRDGYTVEAMVALWADEKRRLDKLRSWEDDFHAVGHYTQMVWSTTTHVGCAVAANAADDYLVCRYTPPGNVEGAQPFPRSRLVRAAAGASRAANCPGRQTAAR